MVADPTDNRTNDGAALRAALEAAGVGVGHVDADGVIESASPAMCRMLSREPDELLGVHLLSLTDRARRSGLLAALIKVIGGVTPSATLGIRFADHSGHWHTVQLTISARPQPAGGAWVVAAARSDSQRDTPLFAPLAVPNPTEDAAVPYRAAQRRSFRGGLPFVALSCQLGFPGGEQLEPQSRAAAARRISDRLRDALRGGDVVMPVEPERLLAIAERVDDLDAAVGLASRLLRVAERPVWIGGSAVEVEISIHGGLVDAAVPFEAVQRVLDSQPGGLHLIGDAIHVADLRIDPAPPGFGTGTHG